MNEESGLENNQPKEDEWNEFMKYDTQRRRLKQNADAKNALLVEEMKAEIEIRKNNPAEC